MDSSAVPGDVTAAPPPTNADVTTPRPARRVTACERLTPEHAVQRQRTTDEPILVAWKVERRANGQELISISSDESSAGDDDEDDGSDEEDANEVVGGYEQGLNGSFSGGGSADASGGENENDDADYEYTSECEADLLPTAGEQQHDSDNKRQMQSHRDEAVAEQQPTRKSVVIDVDDEDEDSEGEAVHVTTEPSAATQPPTIYSIDSEESDSDDECEIVERPLSADDLADQRAIAEARAREPDETLEHAGDAIHDCSTTPEAVTDSSCEVDTRIKSEAAEQLLALKTEPVAEPVVSELVPAESESPAVSAPATIESEDAEEEPVVKPEPIAATARAVVPKKVIPLMRCKKLDEENAAFLLFYGISEAPTTRILGLIIEYIDRCVGESSIFVSRCIKFLLWCKMNAHVNAGSEAERLARSEWMKIVFSSEDPFMRPEIYRSTLLPRPVRITVRPLQLVHKRASSGGYLMNSRTPGTLASPKRVKGEHIGVYTPHQKGLVLNGVLQQLSPPTQTMDFREQAASHTNTLKHRKQPPQTKTKKRKAEKITVLDSPMAQSPITAVPYTPRKHRRRNGSITLYDIELPTRGKAKNGGLPKSSEIVRPLAPNQVIAGINRSLPHSRNLEGDGEEGWEYRKGPCVQVCPLQNMSAEDLKSHIISVRSEGRIKSFEKLSDIISKLMTDPRNYRGLFNAPVDPVALNLPTYTSIVKNPMDLGTVKKRLAEGKYIETQEFANDVRLVFENAKLFNDSKHSVHLCADTLLRHFERELKNGLQKRNPGPKHSCGACYGHTCSLCYQQCLPFAQPHLQCSGSCGTDIRKGSIYYIARDGTRVWCHKCRNKLVREKVGLMSNGSSQSSVSFSQSSSMGGSQMSVDDDTDDPSMVRMKCDTTVEPWVKCSECKSWMHQVCGLFNSVRGAYALEHDFVCPPCCYRQKISTPPPSSSLHNLLNPASNDREASKSTCLNIPPCELSTFIQSFLRQELEAIGEGEAAQTLNVRVLSFPGEKMAIPETVSRAFDENASALKCALPKRDVASQQLPAEVTFLSRGIYLFQKHDGVDVSLFTLYAQEFGESCELAANRKAVYIAYIDSIRYLKPASARTSAYHFIMLAYFDYIRRHGFNRVHIWSCPPQKRISYVFWCRPAFQKTPSAEHLRSWYNRLLEKAKSRRIVRGWTTLYDRYLAREDAALPVKDESQQHLIATRGVTSRSVDLGDLAWPVSELPPIFDGDFVPAELERILGRIDARNGKIRRANESVKNASIGSSGGKRAKGDAAIKDDPEGPLTAAATQHNVEFKLREVFDKLKFAVQRMKQDLLVVHLAAVDSEEESAMTTACRPETTVPKWCQRVPRFFGSRFMFHQLCASAGYQFDSLRRAKHSTMMILHHYFNEHVTQVNVFCRECSLLITHAEYWACQTCDRLALCDACFQRDGLAHNHVLQYGRQLRVAHYSPAPQAHGHQS